MNQRRVVLALILTALLQVLLLGGMLVRAEMPLWTGQEIKVKTVPVDPRSLFRGNYARLRYDFSTLPSSVEFERTPRNNEPVFVSLKPDADGLYVFNSVSLEKPDSGPFLKGRLTHATGKQIRYGIEAWFAPKEKALQLERDLRDGGVAVLMVDVRGKAALKDILPLD